MDGTLLDNDSRVSERSAAIITELSRRGALITVATARTPATVQPLMADIVTRCPAIVMTGASLWDRDRMRYVAPRLMPRDIARDVIDTFARHGVDPFVYTLGSGGALDVYHGCGMNSKESEFYETRRALALKKFHIGYQLPETSRGNVILTFAIGAADRIEPLAAELRNDGRCSVSCYPDICTPGVALIEVFARGVSKAAAVRDLAGRTGAGRVVVFGDNLNDLPMMEVADVAVAVDNALPEVKERADVVIGRNTSDAVARFIAGDYDN